MKTDLPGNGVKYQFDHGHDRVENGKMEMITCNGDRQPFYFIMTERTDDGGPVWPEWPDGPVSTRLPDEWDTLYDDPIPDPESHVDAPRIYGSPHDWYPE